MTQTVNDRIAREAARLAAAKEAKAEAKLNRQVEVRAQRYLDMLAEGPLRFQTIGKS